MIEPGTFCAVCLRLVLNGEVKASYKDRSPAPIHPGNLYTEAYKGRLFETFNGRVYMFAKTKAHGEYRCIVHLEPA